MRSNTASEESPPADRGGPDTSPVAAVDRLFDRVLRRAGRPEGRPANYGRHQVLSVLVFGLAVWAAVLVFDPARSTTGLIQLWLFYVVLATGFYLSFAMAGRIAVCQGFMAALGAYTSAWATRTAPFLVGVLAAVVVTAIVSWLFARLLSRSGHFYFAIATLGLAELGATVFIRWEAFTGPSGLVGSVPPMEVFGLTIRGSHPVIAAFLVVACLFLLIVALVERSPLRREVIATRDLPEVASVAGVPIERYKTGFFVLGSVMAGVGGSMFAHWQTVIAPETFGIDLAIGLFLIVILGGVGSPWGAVLGAAFYVWAPQALKGYEALQSLIYGAILMLVIIVLPDGLVGLGRRAGRSVLRRFRRTPVERPTDA